MLTCYHCGTQFTDPLIEALHAALPGDVPMERHGESGVLLGGDKPELCPVCLALPTDQVVKLIGEMTELMLRKHYGSLS